MDASGVTESARHTPLRRLVDDLWQQLGGDRAVVDRCELTGGGGALPSVFRVTDAAAAAVAVATLAVAEFSTGRTGGVLPAVRVDRRHAAAGFVSERWCRVDGAPPPEPWDPLAGDYRAGDGWVRLHTNYAHHRAAAVGVLGGVADRDQAADAVAAWSMVELESAVVAAGGCAAAMRDSATWADHPQANWLAKQPLMSIETTGAATVSRSDAVLDPSRALSGVRVVDLTRVIAGPVCTRFLAAHGADVLRLDPPGFAEVPALVYDVTSGKRAAFADLGHPSDRHRVEDLIATADVVVVGYRPGALERFGLSPDALAERCPGLVVASLTAWGEGGPWGDRRGFDSLVQMASGIADAGMVAAGADRPRPLPAQALDHGSGYLMAAGVIRALTVRRRSGCGSRVRVSLARTAQWLQSLGGETDPSAPLTEHEVVGHYCETVTGPLGDVQRVTCPGSIEGYAVGWTSPPVALGSTPLPSAGDGWVSPIPP